MSYEPGSTFKLVTISAALEEKVTNPDEVFDCQMGSIVYNGMRIRDSKPHGLLPVWGVLAESSDVGSIKIALRLGEDRFYKYIRAYGFGQQTGIELPGETRGHDQAGEPLVEGFDRGDLDGPGDWYFADSTGRTHFDFRERRSLGGAAHRDRNGAAARPRRRRSRFIPAPSHRVISSYTAAEMRSMMQKVVLEGTGRKAILEGYTSAGKTGTAQKVDPATGAYSKTKYIGSFAGFAPVNNPQIVVAVILDSAVGLHQGGQVSAPVFTRISQQVLEYLHVPHDLPLAPQHQLLLAQAKMKDKDLEEGTPDHPGEPLETAEVNGEFVGARRSPECGAGARACDCRKRRKCGASGDARASHCADRAVRTRAHESAGRECDLDCEVADHRNRRSRRGARRNRSAVVRRQDGARRRGSRAGHRTWNSTPSAAASRGSKLPRPERTWLPERGSPCSSGE